MRATGYSTSTSLRGSGCRASNGLKPSRLAPCAAPESRVACVSFWGGGEVFLKRYTRKPSSSNVRKGAKGEIVGVP